MSGTFTLGGDPGSIRTSAGQWSSFAGNASGASSDLTVLDTTEFSGDEADLYRGRVSADLVPHLNVTSDAWEMVAKALRTYATGLERLQRKMARLSTAHTEQQKVVTAAWNTYQGAKAADTDHAKARKESEEKLEDGQELPTDTYVSTASSDHSAYQTEKNALDALVTAAAAVKAEHTVILKACCNDIGSAKDKRPVAPPGWWDRVKKVAAVAWESAKKTLSIMAKYVSPVLKVISAVAGVLALIPCLTPIMGPIALATGLAALTIDVLNKLINGSDQSWLSIGVDALGLIPGIRPLTTVARGAKLVSAGSKVTKAASSVRAAEKGVATAEKAAAAAKGFVPRVRGVANAMGARLTLNTARFAKKGAAREFAELVRRNNRADAVWDWVERGTDLTAAGMSSADAYRKAMKATDGNRAAALKQAALAGIPGLLGTSIPKTGNKFKAIQNVVAGAGGTAATAYELATNAEARGDWTKWAGLVTSAAGTGVHARNAHAYHQAGNHPDMSPRDAWQTPEYSWSESVEVVGSYARGASGAVGNAVSSVVAAPATLLMAMGGPFG